MGIKNLLLNLKKHHPDLITSKRCKDLSGSTLIIDSSIFFYKAATGMRFKSKGAPGVVELQDKHGNKTAHIIGLVAMARELLVHKINPVFIIDGKPGEIKSATVN